MKLADLMTRQDRQLSVRQWTPVDSVLGWVARRAGGRDTPLLALRILEDLSGVLCRIALDLAARHLPDGRLDLREGMDPRIHHDYVVLVKDLGLTRWASTGLRLDDVYAEAVSGGFDAWRQRLAAADKGPLERIRGRDHRVGDLLDDARGRPAPAALERNDVRYLLTLARYLQELERLDFHGQVNAAFGEEFYTDLGELAFELYTGEPFRDLCRQLGFASLLDVGCGNGNYLAAAQDVLPHVRVVGIERQHHVAERTRERLAARGAAEVVAADFMDWDSAERFDVVLASYMLFYLPVEDRLAFFRKAAGLLAPGGALVVCQYFPDAERIQRILIDHSSPVPAVQRYVSRLGTTLAKAEALLNRILSDFQSVVYWTELVEQLNAAELTVDEVLPAEQMYYSYFIISRHATTGPAPSANVRR